SSSARTANRSSSTTSFANASTVTRDPDRNACSNRLHTSLARRSRLSGIPSKGERFMFRLALPQTHDHMQLAFHGAPRAAQPGGHFSRSFAMHFADGDGPKLAVAGRVQKRQQAVRLVGDFRDELGRGIAANQFFERGQVSRRAAALLTILM